MAPVRSLVTEQVPGSMPSISTMPLAFVVCGPTEPSGRVMVSGIPWMGRSDSSSMTQNFTQLFRHGSVTPPAGVPEPAGDSVSPPLAT